MGGGGEGKIAIGHRLPFLAAGNAVSEGGRTRRSV